MGRGMESDVSNNRAKKVECNLLGGMKKINEYSILSTKISKKKIFCNSGIKCKIAKTQVKYSMHKCFTNNGKQ